MRHQPRVRVTGEGDPPASPVPAQASRRLSQDGAARCRPVGALIASGVCPALRFYLDEACFINFQVFRETYN
jgi:hypothetical protein